MCTYLSICFETFRQLLFTYFLSWKVSCLLTLALGSRRTKAPISSDFQQKEPEYAQKLGEQPVLPLGGPGYDEMGMKR